MTEHSLQVHASKARLRRSCYVALAAIALILGATDPRAQTPRTSATADNSNPGMKQFVFLFRRSHPLSGADQKRLTEEVRAWALRQNGEGHKLDPRMLGEERRLLGPNGNDVSAGRTDDARLAAILFVEARDFAEAVKIAETHPGLRHGNITLEVRAWAPPPAARL